LLKVQPDALWIIRPIISMWRMQATASGSSMIS
jgi:hypothetical protein